VGAAVSPAAAPRRPPVFGPEPWATVAGQEWCHWDLWFCMVAVFDHGGDLEPLEATFVAGLKDPLWGRDGIEAKLSHLADLRTRLAEVGLSPDGLVPPDAGTDKALIAKARRKVADRGLEGRAMTPAMVDTPRARLTRRVRTGRWSAFPVDPARFYRSFRRHVEVKDYISKGRSFGVVRRLEERLRRLDRDDLGAAERVSIRCRAGGCAPSIWRDAGLPSIGTRQLDVRCRNPRERSQRCACASDFQRIRGRRTLTVGGAIALGI